MAIQGASKISCRAAYEKLTSTPPFRIPKNWLWVQMDSISESINVGIVIRPKRYYTSKDEGTPAFRNCNIQGGSIDDSEWVYLKATAAKENPRSVVRYGDVLIARSGNAGNCCVVPKAYSGYGAIDVIIARPLLKFVSPDFLAVNLCAASTQTMLASISRGVALSHLGVTTISSLPMPLPPLAEQKRIVAKVKELFAIADSLGVAAAGLENAAKRLDKKILDLAIRGRLVPQDPNDEPASELVKRIAASHKSPCKNQGKPIDPPFEIPDSWEWVRLGAICEILDSKRKPVAKSKRKPGPYPYYGATCIQDFVSDFIFDESLVLLGEDGAKWGKGDKSAFCVDGKIWVNNHAHVLRPCDGINHIYLVCTLDILDLMPYVTGTTVPKLNQEKMCDIQIPLPPLAEQKRIVAKIEELRAVIKPLTM